MHKYNLFHFNLLHCVYQFKEIFDKEQAYY